MEVLLCLARHAPDLVLKEDLLQKVWPDTFVGEGVLTRCVSELRRVLEDETKVPRIIQTIAKRGYRLIAPVTLVTENVSPVPASIAVLPFLNLSSDPQNEFFCDGISEEVISALAHVKNLHVVARTSSFAFKGKYVDLRAVGEQLNVRTVLEGCVRRSGDRVRITAQLVNAADGYHLWSEKYDREMTDVFAIQEEIAPCAAVVSRVCPPARSSAPHARTTARRGAPRMRPAGSHSPTDVSCPDGLHAGWRSPAGLQH